MNVWCDNTSTIAVCCSSEGTKASILRSRSTSTTLPAARTEHRDLDKGDVSCPAAANSYFANSRDKITCRARQIWRKIEYILAHRVSKSEPVFTQQAVR